MSLYQSFLVKDQTEANEALTQVHREVGIGVEVEYCYQPGRYLLEVWSPPRPTASTTTND